MTSEAKFHPTEEQLEGFAKGSLTAGMNVVISAHVELCETCRGKTSELETKATMEWLQSAPDADADAEDFSALIDSIVQHPQVKSDVRNDNTVSEIHMLDHSVSLPKVLAKVASEGLVWKKLAGGINQATVILDNETQGDLTALMLVNGYLATRLHIQEFTLGFIVQNDSGLIDIIC